MEWMGVNELRESFLSFFESKEHLRMKSAPLVPRDDASLLLINSGMAPLKNYFLGLETPPSKRATTCQKCIRTPDIEQVGKTSRHGTFFEMLGNFSFGDYFKNEAVEWAWEFITEVLKIPKELLWISIYEGDEQAADIWINNHGVSPERIVRLGRDDNFWEIGSGPCGPCSEIHIDRGVERGCGSPDCTVGCDCDRFMEIWNLVFTQYNSDGNGNYTPLEHPNIDTGMGLERLAVIMQNVENLFEVDTMQSIMNHICQIAGKKYKDNDRDDVSLRVVTDHVRSTVFMVGDGVVPQNEGRGYVLRRLLRRAARHGRLLGITQAFLYKVAETVIAENAKAYPELEENKDYIIKVISVEEERFSRTIEQGMQMLHDMIDSVDSKTMSGDVKPIISGEDAFRLYDTFGFPLDLTREIAEDRGVVIDEESFLEFMQQQRERARKAHEAKGGVGWEEDVLAELSLHDEFTGYNELRTDCVVQKIIQNGEITESVTAGEEAVIVLDKTPFYAESGGQVGDTGLINLKNGVFNVFDCKKSPTGHFLHIGELVSGIASVGDSGEAVVDIKRRSAIMRNHTATHLLQAALRAVVGDHVHQAGSMVDDTVCRFDFTHFSAVTPEQLEEVERRVNDWILQSIPVSSREMSMDEAKKLGATALFGDKYSDVVRVITAGDASMELCGGTHVQNTANISLFKLLRESSVAAGVRRIEGTTGEGVLRYIESQNSVINEACKALRCTGSAELAEKAQAVTEHVKELEREVTQLNQTVANMQLSGLTDNMPNIGPVKYVSAVLTNAGPDTLKQAADTLKDRFPNIVGMLAGLGTEKATLLAFAGKEAVKVGVHCGKLVRAVSEMAGGSGGGRPDNAMGGASDVSKINEAVLSAKAIVEEMVKPS